MVYGLNLYIREYFNTTAPSNREVKNAKNAKIANSRNINPAKIKAHTVYTMAMDFGELSLLCAPLRTFPRVVYSVVLLRC